MVGNGAALGPIDRQVLVAGDPGYDDARTVWNAGCGGPTREPCWPA